MSEPLEKNKPKRSENRQAKRTITVRCTDEQHDAIVRRAGGGSKSGYLLASGLNRPKPPSKVTHASLSPDAVDKLACLLAQIGRTGNNLNQIARAFNMDEWLEPHDIALLRESCEEVQQLAFMLKGVLGVKDISKAGRKYVIQVAGQSPLSWMEAAND